MLLTPKQVSAQYGLAVQSLAQYRVAGTGPAYIRLGRAIKYDRADVDAWLESRKVRTSESPASPAGGAK